MTKGNVKKYHNSQYVNGMQMLRYSFHNLKGEIIKIYKVDILEVYVMWKGEKIPITDYQKVNGNKNTLNIFFSPMSLLGRKNGVIRLTIKYKYRNNDKLFEFTDTLKYVDDTQLSQWREQRQKYAQPNKGKGGKKRKNRHKKAFKENIGNIGIL